MAARLLHLIALLAVVLMPLGMAAPASATGAPVAAMHKAERHCDEQSPSQSDESDRIAQCALACAMLLSEAAIVPGRTCIDADRRSWPKLGLMAGARPEMDPPPPKLT